MKKKSSISLGPGASSLILIFVVLSMSILGMLSLMTARNDLHLSERSAESVEQVYRLREAAEERRALIAACLKDGGMDALQAAVSKDLRLAGVTLDGTSVSWNETEGNRTLSCVLSAENGTAWTAQRLSTGLGEESEDEREVNAKYALAQRVLARQAALDAMLEKVAPKAKDWQDYQRLIEGAMTMEPMAEGVTLRDGHFEWIEADDTYRYACTVVVNPLDAERRSDFAATPVLLDDGGEEEVFAD